MSPKTLMNPSLPVSRTFGDLKLQVTGMSCASCALRVEKLLQSIPGVLDACANLATEQAFVEAPLSVTAGVLAGAVRKAGYDVLVEELVLQVEGMTCASCAARVEKVLLNVPDVLSASVNLASERATVEARSTVAVSVPVLKSVVERAGYGATDVRSANLREATPLPDWWPVALSAALTVPLRAPIHPVL